MTDSLDGELPLLQRVAQLQQACSDRVWRALRQMKVGLLVGLRPAILHRSDGLGQRERAKVVQRAVVFVERPSNRGVTVARVVSCPSIVAGVTIVTIVTIVSCPNVAFQRFGAS